MSGVDGQALAEWMHRWQFVSTSLLSSLLLLSVLGDCGVGGSGGGGGGGCGGGGAGGDDRGARAMVERFPCCLCR